ncbi:MAG: ABC transporter substrate-binding protein [Candidatus Faecousia sp.]|nr:ABC transporter substrate-binding protein [Candidatus Faecousia sp.]
MKKALSLLLCLVMLLSLTACSQSGKPQAVTPETTIPETNVPETTVPVSHYPLTVTDQAGREVTIVEEPQRLVSGYYISTSALIALGLDSRLVGIEAKANKRAIYKLSAPELMDLPNVGTAKEFDLEGCAALEPDLVILPIKLKNAAQALEDLGIRVLLVNPENQELLEDMIRLIAAVTDTEDRAQALLDFIADQEAMLTRTLSGLETPSVYLAGNSSLLSTAGEAMYQSDMIRLAGGVNAAAGITDSYWVEISYEQLLTWNPEYLILASDADYTVEDVLADPNLADCAAVKNGNVYQMPDKAEAWDSPVPGSILGCLWLANVLHPQAITEADCAARIDEYYETFYGFTYSER